MQDRLVIAANAAIGQARRYARRVWWAELEDLEQESLCEALTVLDRGTWDPSVGMPFRNYVRRACSYRLRDYVLGLSAPVSAPRGHRQALVGQRRAFVDPDTFEAEDVFEAYEHAQWDARVREQAEFVLVERGYSKAAYVLLYEKTPAEVAAELDERLVDVYRAVERGRRALGDNAELLDLLRQKLEG